MSTEIDWNAPAPKGYWRNRHGDLVREVNISRIDRDMNETCLRIHGFGLALSGQMLRFREHTLSDIYGLVARVVSQYGGRIGGRKGNVQIITYDGRRRVILQQAETIAIGPEIQAAQSIIDELLAEWATGSKRELKALLEQSLRPSAAGEVSVTQLLRLRNAQIDDPRWRRVQDAISDALRPTGKAEYVRLYERNDPSKPWEQVPLHLSTVQGSLRETAEDPAEILEMRTRSAVDEARLSGMSEGAIMDVLRSAKRRGGSGGEADE